MKLATHDLYDDICIWHIFVKYYMIENFQELFVYLFE